jgi:Holliday junction resolvase RusA-like endonuclease
MSADAKVIKTDYQWQAKSQYRNKPTELPLAISVEMYFGTKRKCDIDNFSKLLFDALTEIVWVDDSQIQTASFSKHYDKLNPRIEITIYEKENNNFF